MASFNDPTNTTVYTSVLSTIRSLIASVAKKDYTGDTNVPTGAIRHDNATTSRWQKWNGSAWVDLTVNFGVSSTLATASVALFNLDGLNSGTANGSALVLKAGGSSYAALGNASAIVGGAYDGTPTLYSGTTWDVLGLGIGAGTWPMKYNTTTNAWTYDTSRRSSKDNIRDSGYGLEHVKQLQARQFNYLEAEQFREDVGFIADEVYEVIPELTPLDNQGEPAGVSYDRLTAVLCKAIQQLDAKVEALEARIAVLENV
jgi:hypothetical protein